MKRILTLLLICLLVGVDFAVAQSAKVTGVVTSGDDGEPIVGASVLVVGTSIGTITDIDGRFTMTSIPKDAKELKVSYIGMTTQVVAIKGGVVNVVLRGDTEVLDEVVVTAMGITREKKALGYAIQEVSSKDITKGGQLDVASSLSGKIAGVQVTKAGGAVGASQRIVVRGNSSFGNNQPLIVVDGVPLDNSQSYSDARSGNLDLGSGINDINPDDIESISVLKGGSAALYGMRAGNGVVLITTKSGKKKDRGVVVNYDMDFTVDRVSNLPGLQNKYGQGYKGSEYYYNYYVANKGYTGSYQDYAVGGAGYGFSYVDGMGNGVNDNDDESWGPRLDSGLLIPQYNSPIVNGVRQATPWASNKNNIKDFFETGLSQNHSLSLTSAGEKSTVRASLGYRDQTGTVPNTGLRKVSAQLSATYAFNKYLDFDLSMNYSNSSSDNLIATGYTAGNPMQSILQWFGRQVDMKDLKAKYNTKDENGRPYNWNQAFHVNPYYNVYNNPNIYDRDRLFGKSSIFIKPTDFLKIEGRLGYDTYTNKVDSHILYDTDNPNSWFREMREQNREVNADAIVYYNDRFGKLSVDVLAGANYRDVQYNYSAQGAGSEGLTIPGLYTMSNVKGTPYTNMDHSHIRSNSVYANASLGWASQVFVDMSVRQDWSSTISESFFYPSVSMSWIPTETFKSLQSDVLSFLKIRGGLAKIGNATDAYKTGSYFSAADYTINGESQFYHPTTAPYNNLKPEKVLTKEIGLEAAFLKNRIRFDVALYQKETSDQIMTIEVPRSTGYSYSLINAGKIKNKGIEVQLSGDVIKTKDFQWTASVNWAKDKSTIEELASGLDTYTIGSSWSTYLYAVKGESWGSLYGAGFTYDNEGRAVVGANGLPKLTANQKIGDVTPDWVGGFRNEFSYKDFSFGFLLDFRKGGDFFSVTQMFGAYTGILGFTADGDIREKGVVVGQDVLKNMTFVNEDGTPNATRVSAQSFYYSYYSNKQLDVCDGSFIKLREVHLTYKVPANVLKKTKFIKGASVSLIGNNVANLWLSSRNQAKIDPESSTSVRNSGVGYESNSVPPTRSIGFKLGLTF